jgi:hypothetical protein
MNRTDFNSIVDDPTVFDLGEFNLAKIFHTYCYFDHLHSGQRSSATSTLRAAMTKHFFRRLFSWGWDLFVVMKLGLARSTRPRTVFYGSSGRTARVGTTRYDLYNARIVNEWGREQFIIIEDTEDRSDTLILRKIGQVLFSRCKMAGVLFRPCKIAGVLLPKAPQTLQ